MVRIGLGLCFIVFFQWFFEPALFVVLLLKIIRFWIGVLTFGLNYIFA